MTRKPNHPLLISFLLFQLCHINNALNIKSLFQRSSINDLDDSSSTKKERIEEDISKIAPSTNFRTDERYKSKLLQAYNYDTTKKTTPDPLNTTGTSVYGVDVSFCIHDDIFLENTLDENRKRGQKVFHKFYSGCNHHYVTEEDKNKCMEHEEARIERNLYQPRSMKNFTEIGFQKQRTPSALSKQLSTYWEENHHIGLEKFEKWPIGSTYLNHWSSPTYMLNLPPNLQTYLTDTITPIVQTFLNLKEDVMVSSMYGIRTYESDSVMSPHVDLLPFVATAVLNVAQLLGEDGEDWPLELYAHDGNAYNVTLSPGDMLLYEGHSIIHGRPFPFVGEYYANIYIHFEPIGYSIEQQQQIPTNKNDPKEMYHSILQKRSEGADKVIYSHTIPHIPPYIVENTPEEKRWLQQFPEATPESEENADDATLPDTSYRNLHHAAAAGDLITLKKVPTSYLSRTDANGWQPIHEAARSGNLKVIEYLIEKGGVDVNARTNFGEGGSPLYWAEKVFKEDDKVVRKLKQYGGASIKPNVS